MNALSEHKADKAAAYQRDNAYLKRALDLQEQYVRTLKQQIDELRAGNAALSGQIEVLQGEKTALCVQVNELERCVSTLRANGECLKSEVEALAQENSALCRNEDLLLKERDRLKKESDGLKEDVRSLNAEADKLRKEFDLERKEALRLRVVAETMTAQFNSIENSTIWKLTKPLRKVLDFFKGIGKGKAA